MPIISTPVNALY